MDTRGTDVTAVRRPAYVHGIFTLIRKVAPASDTEKDAAEPGKDFAPDTIPALLDVVTGELVPITDVDAIAAWRIQLREVEYAIDEAKRVADRIILGEMTRRAKWTLRLDAHRNYLTAPSTAATVNYGPAQEVYDTLAKLVAEKVIAPSVLQECVEVVPVAYKVRLGPLKNALKVPAVAKALAGFKRETPPGDRRVAVK